MVDRINDGSLKEMAKPIIWDGVSHPVNGFKVGNYITISKRLANEESEQTGIPIIPLVLYTKADISARSGNG